MAPSLSINNILAQVKQLDKMEQLTLLQRITYLLTKAENQTATTRLGALSGLGDEVWEGEHNIDKYIDEERQW